jgi:hypothetical protein
MDEARTIRLNRQLWRANFITKLVPWFPKPHFTPELGARKVGHNGQGRTDCIEGYLRVKGANTRTTDPHRRRNVDIG